MAQLLDDRLYFQARVEHELELARAATHPEAARVHSILAGLYLARLQPAEPTVTRGVER